MLSGFGLGSPMPLYHAQLGRVNPGWKTEAETDDSGGTFVFVSPGISGRF
jgi:hypothetical protein